MSTATPTDSAAARAMMRRVLAGFALFGLLLAFVPMRNAFRVPRDAKDYDRWYDAGIRVWQGGEVYYVEPDAEPGHYEFTYPHPAALMLAPLASLGLPGMVAVLCLVNVICWPLCVWLTARLLDDENRPRGIAAAGLAGLCIAPMVYECHLLGQPNLLLTTMLVGAMAAVRAGHKSTAACAGRQSIAGTLVAGAAVIKAFPVVFIGWLAWRGQWLGVVVSIVMTALLLLGLGLPWRSLEENAADVRTWAVGMAGSPSSDALVGAKGAMSWHHTNQAGIAVFHRLIGQAPCDEDEVNHIDIHVNVLWLDFRTVNKVALAFAVLMGLLYMARTWAWPPGRAAWPAQDGALALLLMLMTSPYSRTYTWAALILPLAVLVQDVFRRIDARRPFARRALLLAAAMAVFASTLMSKVGILWPQYVGCLFWATLALFVLVAGLRRPSDATLKMNPT